MRVRPVEGRVFITPCRARLPFRFGMHTMTAAPLALCEVEVELAGARRSRGYSSDLLVPKWFEKNPDVPITKDWTDLIASQLSAIDILLDGGRAPSDTAFAHWRRVYAECVEAAPARSPDLLVRGEGVSLVERAMIDAVCRRARLGLRQALSADLLGFDGALLDPAVAGWAPSSRFGAPTTRIALRHTVGLADALEPEDLTSATRVNDGLPECLAEDIRTFGLTHFKIKISGDSNEQIDRLARIWRVIRREVEGSPRTTLDGNEQFDSIARLADLLERIDPDPRFEGFTDSLLLIEQPLPRTRTFDPDANRAVDRLSRFAPCIIDEADATLDALPHADALGYRGVSVKNCKGVFRALLNRARCDLSAGRLMQSAEDLTNLPAIALQQDLATAATLGLTHVERNGHHYFRGLEHLPPVERAWSLAHHDDLYTTKPRPGAGEPQPPVPHLHIHRGHLSLNSILDAPAFGYAGPVSLDQRIPAERWDPASLA